MVLCAGKSMSYTFYLQLRTLDRICLCGTGKVDSAFKIFQSFRMSSSSTSTVDRKEVDLHNKLKDEWWDDRGQMKALHAYNAIRVPFIRDGLVNSGVISAASAKTKDALKDLKILDVGCGGGLLTEPLSMLKANVTGIEPSTELVEVAKNHASLNPLTKNIRYLASTIEDHLKDHNSYYDAIVASEVVEHVVNPELFIKSCVTALKPGGSIFITTPNKTYMAWFLGIIVAENVLNIVPKGTHSYDKFIPPHQLQQILEKNDCRTVQISGAFYNVLSNRWSWIPSKQLCYALHAVKSVT